MTITTNHITRKAVLIIEDNKGKFRIIHRILTHQFPGIEWLRATSFNEARQMMNEIDFDFVVTDANYPIQHGAEPSAIGYRFSVRECRERGIPFVVVSGSTPPPDINEEQWILFDGDIVEPLCNAVRSALGWAPRSEPRRPSVRRLPEPRIVGAGFAGGHMKTRTKSS